MNGPDWQREFVALFQECAAQEPPEGSGLAETLDSFQNSYDEAIKMTPDDIEKFLNG